MGFKNVFQTITLPVIRKGALHVTVITIKNRNGNSTEYN